MSTLGYLGDDEDLDYVVYKDIGRLQEKELTAKDVTDALRTVAGLHHRHRDLYGLPKEEERALKTEYAKHFKILSKYMQSRMQADTGSSNWCLWDKYFSPVMFNDIKLMVMSVTWGGAAICPFKADDNRAYHGYEYGSRDYCVYNTEDDEVVMFNDLNLHMAEHHSFWEGSTNYRLDPIKVVDCLRLRRDSVSKGDTISKTVWSYTAASGAGPGDDYPSSIKRWASAEHTEVMISGDVIGFFSSKSCPPILKEDMRDYGGTEVYFHCWVPKGVKNTSIAGAELLTSHVWPGALNVMKKREYTYYPLESEQT